MPPDPAQPPVVLRALGSSPPERPLRVVPWDGPAVGGTALDPRSAYVEAFWLPVLGPSATWLVRRLADRLEDDPGGYVLHPTPTAASLGLVAGGRHSSFHRALGRLQRFALVTPLAPDTLAVRRWMPPVPDRFVHRLPVALQAEHERWEAWQASEAFSDERRRTRTAALSMRATGRSPRAVERRLHAWGAHPALAYDGAYGVPAGVDDDDDR